MDDNKYWKTKDFKNLSGKWKQKLAESGFNDIENEQGSLNTWSTHSHKKKLVSLERFENKELYYRWAGFFLHEYNFKSEIEKMIWDFHSSGISVRNIVIELKKRGIEKSGYRSFVSIQKTISRLATIMKKTYGVNNHG